MSHWTDDGDLVIYNPLPCTHITSSHDADHGSDGSGVSDLVINDVTHGHSHEYVDGKETIIWSRSDGETDANLFVASHVCTHPHPNLDLSQNYNIQVQLGNSTVTYTHKHVGSLMHDGRSAVWSRSPSGSPSGDLLHPPCYHSPF